MRIRITSLPRDGEFDEFDLRRFQVGDVYELPSQFGSLLIIAGYAEPASSAPERRAQAADFSRSRVLKPKA
jgi:hypothetical protein